MNQQQRALVVEYLPLIRRVIGKKWRGVIQSADFDELCQEGALGLMDAARRFDASRGMSFKNYAALRILGNASDYLRRIGNGGNRIRRRSVAMRHNMDRMVATTSANENQVGAVRGAVERRLGSLPPRTAAMAMLHVFDGVPLRLVGKAHGLSESMACRLLHSIRECVLAMIEHEIALEAS